MDMNDSVNRGEKVREIYASALERGRLWVPLSLLGPVLLLLLQLFFLLPKRSDKSIHTPSAFWLVI